MKQRLLVTTACTSTTNNFTNPNDCCYRNQHMS